jgi:hypothetical protein
MLAASQPLYRQLFMTRNAGAKTAQSGAQKVPIDVFFVPPEEI